MRWVRSSRKLLANYSDRPAVVVAAVIAAVEDDAGAAGAGVDVKCLVETQNSSAEPSGSTSGEQPLVKVRQESRRTTDLGSLRALQRSSASAAAAVVADDDGLETCA